MGRIVCYKNEKDFTQHFISCLKCMKSNTKEIANLILKQGDLTRSFKIEMIFEAGEVAKYNIICEKFIREEEIEK